MSLILMGNPSGIVKGGLVAHYDFIKQNIIRQSEQPLFSGAPTPENRSDGGYYTENYRRFTRGASGFGMYASIPGGPFELNYQASFRFIVRGVGGTIGKSIRTFPRAVQTTPTTYVRNGTPVIDVVLTSEWQIIDVPFGSIDTTNITAWQRFELFIQDIGGNWVEGDSFDICGLHGNEGSILLPHEITNDNQTLLDHSGNNYHGTLGSGSGADTNDPIWGNNRLDFDGVDDYVQSTTDTIPVGSDSTIIVVVDPIRSDRYSNSTDAYSGIAGWVNGGNTVGHHSFLIRSGTGPAHFIQVHHQASDNITHDTLYNPSSRMSKPTLLSATRKGNVARIYMDKEMVVEEAEGADGLIARSAFRIGNPRQQHGDFPIYYVMAYNRALSEAEVKQNYRALKQKLKGRGIEI